MSDKVNILIFYPNFHLDTL